MVDIYKRVLFRYRKERILVICYNRDWVKGYEGLNR